MIRQERSFYYLDIVQIFLLLLLLSIGATLIYSATYSSLIPYSIFFKKQCFGILLGCFFYCLALFVNHHSFIKYGHLAYCFLIVLLGLTLIKGSFGMGAQRWLDLGLFKFQPSELSKLLFPPFLTHFILHREKITNANRIFILSMIGISFILIAKQPDLGTALLFLFSSISMCFFSTIINRRFIIIVSLLGSLLHPFLWHSLKPYQKKRILVFLGYGDIKKEAYQKEQALIAIGSGGITGKGFLEGSQNKLQFLPEGRTDFIFAVMCEEFGLVGSLFLIFVYILLFLRFFLVLQVNNNPIIRILAFGLIVHIIFAFLINIGMVIGILPVVGIPLPLISYGLTHLWITLISLGLFQNITMHRLYRND